MNLMHSLGRALDHARNGTLLAALRRRVAARRAQEPNRFGVRRPEDTPAVLAYLSKVACTQPGQQILLVGESDAYCDSVAAEVQRLGLTSRSIAPQAVAGLDSAALANVGCITIASLDARLQLSIARQLVRTPAAASIPLEYVALPHVENAAMARYDRYQNEDFVTPLVAESGDAFYRIYERSLERFQQKTEIRDYLDFSQILKSLAQRAVPGNVAEFGSYWGHSGWLLSNVLEQLGSDKTLFMFDMFENFPVEDAGVDRFWSGTHPVDFESVRAKFTDRPNVKLVKGDFTKTLLNTDTGLLAFAFIDCDSYRATKFLLEYLWETRMPVGGVVAMEDYGHAALLGNRVAVHEFFDGRRDAYTWYSQFSGIFIAVKLA